jgi:hypothetical protein
VTEKDIETRQIEHLHLDLRDRLWSLPCFNPFPDHSGGDRLLAVQQNPQGVVYPRLVLSRRQLEDLQVLARGMSRHRLTELVVSHPKPAGGKEVLPIAVILECARLAHEPIDHVAIVNPVLPLTAKPRNPVDDAPGEPDLQFFSVEPNVNLFADKTTLD